MWPCDMFHYKGKWYVDLSKDWEAAPEKASDKNETSKAQKEAFNKAVEAAPKKAFYTFKTRSEKNEAFNKAVSGLLSLSKPRPGGQGGKAMEEDEDLLTQK